MKMTFLFDYLIFLLTADNSVSLLVLNLTASGWLLVVERWSHNVVDDKVLKHAEVER